MPQLVALVIILLIAQQGSFAQDTIPSSGPTFHSGDTVKADVIAIASLQGYPTSIDKIGSEPDTMMTMDSTIVITSGSVIETPVEATPASDGPKRDWSNPPGYVGKPGKQVTMTKKKVKHHKKYHHRKKKRCFRF